MSDPKGVALRLELAGISELLAPQNCRFAVGGESATFPAPMRTLTRYILWELTSVFLATLATMTLFVFLALLGKEAVDNGLGLAAIVRLLPYMLPQAMQFAVPGALLLAAAVVYGRVAASNEIVAVKSLGISPMVMVWPALALATVISFSAVMLNDIAVSWGHDGVERVVLESLEDIAYGRLRTAKNYSTDRLKVYVQRVQGRQLIKTTIQFSSSSNRPPSLITAEVAELQADPAKNAVTIRLWGADGDIDGWSIVHPGQFEQSLPLDEFLGRKQKTRTPSYYALREIGPSRVEQEREIATIKTSMSADAGAALLFGASDELAVPWWHERTRSLNGALETLHRLETEPYRRWSNGFSCLSFVLIGAPMAIRRRHGEFWGSFFACFLPILLVYYPMLVGCVDKAKDGVLPPPAVWMGNLVLAGWGVWLMRRVIRY